MSEIPIERGVKIVHGTYNAETGVVTYFAPITIGDKVRCATDEALAEGFAKLTDPTKIPMYNGKDMRGNADVFLEWLQQEATP